MELNALFVRRQGGVGQRNVGGVEIKVEVSDAGLVVGDEGFGKAGVELMKRRRRDDQGQDAAREKGGFADDHLERWDAGDRTTGRREPCLELVGVLGALECNVRPRGAFGGDPEPCIDQRIREALDLGD